MSHSATPELPLRGTGDHDRQQRAFHPSGRRAALRSCLRMTAHPKLLVKLSVWEMRDGDHRGRRLQNRLKCHPLPQSLCAIALNQLKELRVCAPEPLRAELAGLSLPVLARTVAAWRLPTWPCAESDGRSPNSTPRSPRWTPTSTPWSPTPPQPQCPVRRRNRHRRATAGHHRRGLPQPSGSSHVQLGHTRAGRDHPYLTAN